MAWSAGPFLALAVYACVAPTRAEAGCSHYVLYRSGQDQLARFLDPSVIGQSEILPVESLPPPEHPRPCSGPTCSQNQPMPSSPTLTEIRYVETWAWLGAILTLPEPSSAHHLPLLIEARPAVLSPGVFHPPRVG